MSLKHINSFNFTSLEVGGIIAPLLQMGKEFREDIYLLLATRKDDIELESATNTTPIQETEAHP